jgi:hypothetical protein
MYQFNKNPHQNFKGMLLRNTKINPKFTENNKRRQKAKAILIKRSNDVFQYQTSNYNTEP